VLGIVVPLVRGGDVAELWFTAAFVVELLVTTFQSLARRRCGGTLVRGGVVAELLVTTFQSLAAVVLAEERRRLSITPSTPCPCDPTLRSFI